MADSSAQWLVSALEQPSGLGSAFSELLADRSILDTIFLHVPPSALLGPIRETIDAQWFGGGAESFARFDELVRFVQVVCRRCDVRTAI